MNTTFQRAAEMVGEFSHGNWDRLFPASRLEFEDHDHITEKGAGSVSKMMSSAKSVYANEL